MFRLLFIFVYLSLSPIILFISHHAAYLPSYCLSPIMLLISHHAVYLPSCCLSPIMLFISHHAVYLPSYCLSPIILFISHHTVYLPSCCLSPIILFISHHTVYLQSYNLLNFEMFTLLLRCKSFLGTNKEFYKRDTPFMKVRLFNNRRGLNISSAVKDLSFPQNER